MVKDENKMKAQRMEEVQTLRGQGSRLTRSERKQAEEALRISEVKYRSVLDNMEEGYYEVDLSGRFTFFNRAMSHLIGYAEEKMMGMNNRTFMDEKTARNVFQTFNEVYRTGLPAKCFDVELIRKDGKRIFVEISISLIRNPSGQPNGFRGIVRDVTDRKEAEALYKTLVNSSQASIYIVQDGRFRVANPHSIRYSGFSERELIDAEALDFVHPEDHDRVRACAVDMLKGKRSIPYEYRILDRCGRVRHLVETVTPISYKGRQAVLGNTMDITLIKEMEQSLLDSEKRYKTIFENTGAATAILEEDATISLANTECANLAGYTREEIEGKKKWTEFVAREDVERMLTQHRLRRTDGNRALRSYEFDFVDKAGRVKNVFLVIDVLPGTSKSVASLLDITERKQMEKALRESEEKYRTTVEAATESIFIVQDGVIKYSNETAKRRSGYSDEELASLSFLHLVHPDDRDMLADRYQRRLRGEQVSNRYELKCVSRSGEVIYTDTGVDLIAWEGRPAYLIFASDITERKRLETQLQRAQRMETIGTLAGGIAHDFNNILSAIMGYTELVLTDLSQDGRNYQYLSKVFKASERAKDLVKQILDFSRQSQQELHPLKMAPIVKEAVKLLRASIPATMKIVQHIRDGRDLVMANPTQIQQVLMNLCTNAAHAMRERGGILTIRLTEKTFTRDDLTSLSDLKPGPYAELAVSDTGHGIDPTVMGRIFDPFFTTKTRGEGTGMGLSVVHGIVKSHDGHIHVESDVGKGSTFYVYLPILAEKKKDLPVEDEAPAIGGGERILFVDDEPELTELIREMLIDLGYTVVSRTSSVDALGLFRADPQQFDLVITDQTMPNMTGMDLARELFKIRPGIPIVLCTGFSEVVTPDMVQSAGISEYVMKPIVKRQIAESIRRALETTTGRREKWVES